MVHRKGVQRTARYSETGIIREGTNIVERGHKQEKERRGEGKEDFLEY